MSLSIRNYRHYVYALLLLLPSFAGVPAEAYLLFIGVVLIFEKEQLTMNFKAFKDNPFNHKYSVVWGVMFILILSLANKLFNGQSILCARDYYAPFYLFPFLVLTSFLAFDLKLFKAIIVLVAFEVFFALIEYFMGVRSIIIDLGESNVIHDYSLFYNSRVYGLGVNSSVISLKLFVAFVLLDFVKFKPWQNWALRLVISIGLLISFSRIVVVLVLIYMACRFIYNLWKLKMEAIRETSVRFAAVVFIFFTIFSTTMIDQLLRGDHEAESIFTPIEQPENYQFSCAETHAIPKLAGELNPEKQGWGDRLMMSAENVQSSGRKVIWLNYLNYIEKNLVFGNGSDKLMLRDWDPEKGQMKLIHAHNSYIELIASNGIIISVIILLLYFFLFKSHNYLPVFIIGLYSLGNYGIFWGFSFLDVIFLMLLIFNLNVQYDDQGKG